MAIPATAKSNRYIAPVAYTYRTGAERKERVGAPARRQDPGLRAMACATSLRQG